MPAHGHHRAIASSSRNRNAKHAGLLRLVSIQPAIQGATASYSSPPGEKDEGFLDLFRKNLENGGFFDRAAFGKTLDIQILGINDVGLAVHDQIGDDAAGCGGM